MQALLAFLLFVLCIPAALAANANETMPPSARVFMRSTTTPVPKTTVNRTSLPPLNGTTTSPATTLSNQATRTATLNTTAPNATNMTTPTEEPPTDTPELDVADEAGDFPWVVLAQQLEATLLH
ncbi:unnamed protein product [Aphanomyces euteiches]|uniref:RxLR effector protein n=1 Tax=Aphanomyces euteiches TaxID=100861 RepID=A0A6G0X097_9STRA|nr:hypothetical protein Ae201684_009998 [Aphanomyces euteiches]KAH9095923.1 hypothetical protein Ae201684P_010132 [Aphanomyces euteiches]KAH9112935.1 hypothetical protein AeMF1_012820 [Aphanomyces euteiches]KAH9156824.1 hypothetical protein AeRB84_001275 [Aphanomyces euteiches]KAH9185344.1 hypothetical protein AeNC1_012682 [Aphanomyces euteiches]